MKSTVNIMVVLVMAGSRVNSHCWTVSTSESFTTGIRAVVKTMPNKDFRRAIYWLNSRICSEKFDADPS